MEKYKIIIDTNLWISFLIGKKLPVLKNLLSNKDLTIYVCDHLFNEITRVTGKAKIRKHISDDDMMALAELMDMCCTYVVLRKTAISPIRDGNDLFLLSLAETVCADFILTGDKDLLTLQQHLHTKIVTFRQFEAIIEV